MSYERRSGRRIRVSGHVSPPIALDVAGSTPDELTTALRDAMLAAGGQEYVDEYALDVKRRRAGKRTTT
jgi:hypothetical protein